MSIANNHFEYNNLNDCVNMEDLGLHYVSSVIYSKNRISVAYIYTDSNGEMVNEIIDFESKDDLQKMKLICERLLKENT